MKHRPLPRTFYEGDPTTQAIRDAGLFGLRTFDGIRHDRTPEAHDTLALATDYLVQAGVIADMHVIKGDEGERKAPRLTSPRLAAEFIGGQVLRMVQAHLEPGQPGAVAEGLETVDREVATYRIALGGEPTPSDVVAMGNRPVSNDVMPVVHHFPTI
ncbi:MAG TPA: hypothetical protein VD735_03460 [Candidatus Saccharimonadales bacterium]|nr:hypothetical protein [Candidatus Saccharimonadales bacterium]